MDVDARAHGPATTGVSRGLAEIAVIRMGDGGYESGVMVQVRPSDTNAKPW